MMQEGHFSQDSARFRRRLAIRSFDQGQGSQALADPFRPDEEVGMGQPAIAQRIAQNRYRFFLSQNLVKGHPSTSEFAGKMGDDLLVKGLLVFHPI